MPFYIRKSVTAGPFRFNFSKSGVGVSVGVKGLRIGTGPRGHYIHAGRGGLYYRATLSNAGRDRHSQTPPQQSPSLRPTFDADDVTMLEIESGDVMHMRDASFSELLDEINSKARQTRLSWAFPLAALLVATIASLAFGGPGLLLCAAAVPAWIMGKWLDSYRRTTVLYYELEGDAESAYKGLSEGFDGLMGCSAKWHIEAGGAIESLTAWKRNAGASYLVNRKSTALTYALPAVIKSNLTPPVLHVGKQKMYFLPDIVLLEHGSRIGAVNYADLNVRWQDSRFIETERVPSDARIVDYTWKHPNKSGGPDRRFRDNSQIPVCLYEAMHLTSNSGVNELLEFSKTGVVAAFFDGCRRLAILPRERESTRALASEPSVDGISFGPPEKKKKTSKMAAAVLSVLAGLLILISIYVSNKDMTGAGSKISSFSTIPDRQAAAVNKPAPPGRTEVKPAPQETASPKIDNIPSKLSSVQGLGQADVRYTLTDVNLRQGPGTKFGIIVVVPKGTKVSVIEANRGWSRVQIDLNTSGWMANSTISER